MIAFPLLHKVKRCCTRGICSIEIYMYVVYSFQLASIIHVLEEFESPIDLLRDPIDLYQNFYIYVLSTQFHIRNGIYVYVRRCMWK